MKILCSKFLSVGFLLAYHGKNLSISDLSLIRSQSQMQAVFLRHEGYLGALGALMSYGDPSGENLTLEEKVSFNKDILRHLSLPYAQSPAPLCTRKMLLSTGIMLK
jgi:hypothetical protein